MASPIDFDNAAVGPACLPKAGAGGDYEGQFCHISGWGFTMASKEKPWDERLQTVASQVWRSGDKLCCGSGLISRRKEYKNKVIICGQGKQRSWKH
jgi:hypothetical protein